MKEDYRKLNGHLRPFSRLLTFLSGSPVKVKFGPPDERRQKSDEAKGKECTPWLTYASRIPPRTKKTHPSAYSQECNLYTAQKHRQKKGDDHQMVAMI